MATRNANNRAELSQQATTVRQRWNIELGIRLIKTTMQLAVLRCKSPAMIEKKLWVHWLACNLIRTTMAQAAAHADVHPHSKSQGTSASGRVLSAAMT